jgi:8-oxo-dGTP pyrophosphatase MutT (NUDIX family)
MSKTCKENQITKIADTINGSERKILESKRDFAVFIPLVMHEPTIKPGSGATEPCLLLELRGKHIHRQPGEISFPGGEVEEGETFEEAAVRETCEELGLEPGDIKVLAEFDKLVNYSGFTIHIYYGTIEQEALSRMHLSEAEVAEVFYVPLRALLEAEARGTSSGTDVPPSPQGEGSSPEVEYLLPKVDIVVDVPEDFPYPRLGLDRSYGWRVGHMEIPVYSYGPYPIWGITGRIIKAFLGYVREALR